MTVDLGSNPPAPFPRIAVLMAQLEVGGIQRMRLHIIEFMVDQGYEVDLVVGSDDGPLATLVPESVSIFAVARRSNVTFFPNLVRYLRRRKPTHILSSYGDITIMAIAANWLLRSNITILASTHNALSKLPTEGGRLRSIRYALLYPVMRLLYPRAAALVAVSHGAAEDLHTVLGIPRNSVEVIYNPVIDASFEARLAEPPPDNLCGDVDMPLIGYFGRLHRQKRPDLLLRAFQQVRQERECKLLVVGEGPEGPALQRLARELGIERDVVFQGFLENPLPYMRACQLTVLPSDSEGLGNVLVESMACGVQVVATDCPHGPAEILDGGRYGQLVPVGDAVAMAQAIEASLAGTFWVEPSMLVERGQQFTSRAASEKYLQVLGLPVRVPS